MTAFPGELGEDSAVRRAGGTFDGNDGRPLVSRSRTMMVHASLVVFALALVNSAVKVQLVNATQWERQAEKQQVNARDVVPPRGRILDANGLVMVESRELIRLGFSPQQLIKYRKRGAKRTDPLIDARKVVRTGLKGLVHDSLIRRVLDTTRKWVQLPTLFLPSEVERFNGVPGIRRERVFQRNILATPGIRGFLGTVRDQIAPVGGIEQELDSLLRGVSGRNALLKDPKGGYIETPALHGVAARPGHDVRLTINLALQEIAERKLIDGISRTGASGGDVVIVDPRDGAVLAMSGVRKGRASATATVLAEPFEPGSVMKPFVVTRALELKRVHPDDMINTEGGRWTVAKRVVTDEHKAAFMSVRNVIRQSSNIGAIKIAMTLSEREEYEALRDYGFGTATGVPYPAESRGQLPTPKWQAQVASSVAMGYGMSATPLQIAAAYVAIANGGELLQPTMVREVRDPDGALVFTQERRVVRRVMQPATAQLMRTILASVVDSGTAMAADMATYDVAGKSGTARRAEHGVYVEGNYNSTFAGMFPAQAPQYVLVVRLIDPEGKIFGGTVAGRIVNEILQAALATRDASLDRRALAAVSKPLPVAAPRVLTASAIAQAQRDTARFDSLRAPAPAPVPVIALPSRVVVSLPYEPDLRALKARAHAVSLANADGGAPRTSLRPVPSVFGLDARQAALALHAAGFRITMATGSSTRTRPVAGTLVRGGSVVVLETLK